MAKLEIDEIRLRIILDEAYIFGKNNGWKSSFDEWVKKVLKRLRNDQKISKE